MFLMFKNELMGFVLASKICRCNTFFLIPVEMEDETGDGSVVKFMNIISKIRL